MLTKLRIFKFYDTNHYMRQKVESNQKQKTKIKIKIIIIRLMII